MFAHCSAIATSGYRSLEENQKVQFDVAQGPKGPQAENILPLSAVREKKLAGQPRASFSVFQHI